MYLNDIEFRLHIDLGDIEWSTQFCPEAALSLLDEGYCLYDYGKSVFVKDATGMNNFLCDRVREFLRGDQCEACHWPVPIWDAVTETHVGAISVARLSEQS